MKDVQPQMEKNLKTVVALCKLFKLIINQLLKIITKAIISLIFDI